MIFFKTHRQEYEEEQARLKALYQKRTKWFAWRPVILEDGRVAFFHTVYVERAISLYDKYSDSGVNYYYLEPN